MVKQAIFSLIGLLPVTAGAMPQSFTIQFVKVEQDGRWHSDPNGHQTKQYCSRFKLRPAAAFRWFKNSREVTKQDWLERLDWTQCWAKGSLVTGDRRTYHWELDQSGRGRVIISPTLSVYLAGHQITHGR